MHNICSDGSNEFWVLTTALAFAQRRIRRLKLCSLPPGLFDDVDHLTQISVDCSIDVYFRVEYLSLGISQDLGIVKVRSKLGKLWGLQSLLRSMTGLKDPASLAFF